MAQPRKNTPRKPATKFPQLQKKLRQLSAGKKQSNLQKLHRERFLRDR
jgi:hypothetical protein